MVAATKSESLFCPSVVSSGGGGYHPINPEDGHLLDRFFPDIRRADTIYPRRYNPHVAKTRAALETWIKAWYRPKVTYYPKFIKDTRMGYDRFRIWRR